MELDRQVLSLAFVHRDEFPDVVAPVAPEPERVNEGSVYGAMSAMSLPQFLFGGARSVGRPGRWRAMRRPPKGSVNALYAQILASHALATIEEAFAVAPGLQHVRLLVIHGDRLGGGLQLIPLYAGAFDRGALQRTDWEDLNVRGFIEAHGDIRYKGQAQEVAPLATKGDPELRGTVDHLARQLDWKPAPGTTNRMSSLAIDFRVRWPCSLT